MARAWWASMRRRWRGSATGPDGGGPPAPPAPADAAPRAPLSTVDAQAPFLAAQAADPFDATPMLIHADWLEEQGDATGAAVLRGLAEAGMPSIAALALGATLVSLVYWPDCFWDQGGAGRGDNWIVSHGNGESEDGGEELQSTESDNNGDGESGDDFGD